MAAHLDPNPPAHATEQEAGGISGDGLASRPVSANDETWPTRSSNAAATALAAPQHRANLHADVEASSARLAELDQLLHVAWQHYENFLDLADDEPEQASASTVAWDAAFLAFHTARVQRDSHWRKHIHLETDLLSATHASDMFLVSRGLTTSAGSLRAGIWTLSEAERNMMSH